MDTDEQVQTAITALGSQVGNAPETQYPGWDGVTGSSHLGAAQGWAAPQQCVRITLRLGALFGCLWSAVAAAPSVLGPPVCTPQGPGSDLLLLAQHQEIRKYDLMRILLFPLCSEECNINSS